MTKEQDYFKMAMDSGARPTIDNSPTQVWFSMSQLERFATLVGNAKLEEAAKKCDALYFNLNAGPDTCAQAIRAMKEPT